MENEKNSPSVASDTTEVRTAHSDANRQIEIDFGGTSCYYTHRDHYTQLYDEEGDRLTSINWVATEKEIIAAFYAYYAGYKAGENSGKLQKIREIKEALQIS